MDNKRLWYSELIGIVAVYSLAVLLHFIYPLSGGATLAILFGAVNESVWEHVKIFGAAYVAYALLQLMWLRVPFRRYVVAKVMGLYTLSASIIGFYYAYTALTGYKIAAVDVLSGLIFTAGAQVLSAWLIQSDLKIEEAFHAALCLLMLYFLMFFSFTIFPPRWGLFRDPVSGRYGILPDTVDIGAIVLNIGAKKM